MADRKKSRLRSTPARKRQVDLDAFAAGAGRTGDRDTVYPWQEPHVRDDVKKSIPLRLPETLYLKLKYIADNTPYSMNSFILERLEQVIEEELRRL